MGTNASPIPILFVLIGWARRYDGTEFITGNQSFIQKHPLDNGEAEAFIKQDDGFYRCGVGRGKLREDTLDIVFVARREKDDMYEAVGVYRRAKVRKMEKSGWTEVRTKNAKLFPSNQRLAVRRWPIGQGMRRWAKRVSSVGRVHPKLMPLYHSAVSPHRGVQAHSVELDPELSAFEGEPRRFFIVHRRREAKLRVAKNNQALREGNGRLTCEVPKCGFDFLTRYGEIGRRYAVVHHKTPLAESRAKRSRTALDDLAIVCANCHAMIHRGGQCRPLRSLLLRRRAP